jgi:hypothetical protein
MSWWLVNGGCETERCSESMLSEPEGALLRKRADFGVVRSDSTGARYRISWRQGGDSDSGPN